LIDGALTPSCFGPISFDDILTQPTLEISARRVIGEIDQGIDPDKNSKKCMRARARARVSLKNRFFIKIASFLLKLFPSLFESRQREKEREGGGDKFKNAIKFMNALGRRRTIPSSLLSANVRIGIPKPWNGNCKHGYAVAAPIISNFRDISVQRRVSFFFFVSSKPF
jgi:hypothetical protein